MTYINSFQIIYCGWVLPDLRPCVCAECWHLIAVTLQASSSLLLTHSATVAPLTGPSVRHELQPLRLGQATIMSMSITACRLCYWTYESELSWKGWGQEKEYVFLLCFSFRANLLTLWTGDRSIFCFFSPPSVSYSFVWLCHYNL